MQGLRGGSLTYLSVWSPGSEAACDLLLAALSGALLVAFTMSCEWDKQC